MTRTPTTVSSLLRPQALNRAQAQTILDEILTDFRRVDADLTALRKKCLVFQQGEGWKSLGYGSQKACLLKVFGFSEQRFFQLTAAAEIEKDIALDSTTVESPPTERALRPLKQVDPGQRAEVFREAVRLAEKDDEKAPVVTERHTKAAVKTVVDPASNGQKGKGKDPLPVDGLGKPVPNRKLQPAFEIAQELGRMMRQVSAIRTFLKDKVVGSDVGSRLKADDLRQWGTTLDDLRNYLKFARPHAACVYCNGADAKCDACKGQGWLNKISYDQAPAEKKPK